jgi:histidine triad (HIT) family protein
MHFIVLAKDTKIKLTHDEATLGHMMVVAAKVAKAQGLEEGFRVVVNHGKNSFQTIPNVYLHVIGG